MNALRQYADLPVADRISMINSIIDRQVLNSSCDIIAVNAGANAAEQKHGPILRDLINLSVALRLTEDGPLVQFNRLVGSLYERCGVDPNDATRSHHVFKESHLALIKMTGAIATFLAGLAPRDQWFRLIGTVFLVARERHLEPHTMPGDDAAWWVVLTRHYTSEEYRQSRFRAVAAANDTQTVMDVFIKPMMERDLVGEPQARKLYVQHLSQPNSKSAIFRHAERICSETREAARQEIETEIARVWGERHAQRT